MVTLHLPTTKLLKHIERGGSDWRMFIDVYAHIPETPGAQPLFAVYIERDDDVYEYKTKRWYIRDLDGWWIADRQMYNHNILEKLNTPARQNAADECEDIVRPIVKEWMQ